MYFNRVQCTSLASFDKDLLVKVFTIFLYSTVHVLFLVVNPAIY